MDQQEERSDPQPSQPKPANVAPTLDDLLRAFRDGGQDRVGLLMLRADGKKMVPSPADLCLAYQKGGKEFLAALMANMDGDEPDDSDPEWDERRWR